MKRRRLFLGGIVLLVLAGCYGTDQIVVSDDPSTKAVGVVDSEAESEAAAAEAVPSEVMPHEDLDAALWMQTSAEFVAAAREVYRMAEAGLQAAVADPQWSADVEQRRQEGALPGKPAVIVDLDETVLDNSAFQSRLILHDKEFSSEAWNEWVAEARAGVVPGASEFIQACRDLDITVFFVTNRDCKMEWATRRNLERLGIIEVDAPDTILSKRERENWGSDKKTRRAFVALRHRIVMLIGDDLNDFISIPDEQPAARRALAHDQATFWGTRWFLIPNAVYGGWERSLYGNQRELSRRQKLEKKRAQLDSAETDAASPGGNTLSAPESAAGASLGLILVAPVCVTGRRCNGARLSAFYRELHGGR